MLIIFYCHYLTSFGMHVLDPRRHTYGNLLEKEGNLNTIRFETVLHLYLSMNLNTFLSAVTKKLTI